MKEEKVSTFKLINYVDGTEIKKEDETENIWFFNLIDFKVYSPDGKDLGYLHHPDLRKKWKENPVGTLNELMRCEFE